MSKRSPTSSPDINVLKIASLLAAQTRVVNHGHDCIDAETMPFPEVLDRYLECESKEFEELSADDVTFAIKLLDGHFVFTAIAKWRWHVLCFEG